MKIGDFKTTIQGPSGIYYFESEKTADVFIVNLIYRETEILLDDYIVKTLNEVLDLHRSIVLAIDMNTVPEIISKCPICGYIDVSPSLKDFCQNCNKEVVLRRFIM